LLCGKIQLLLEATAATATAAKELVVLQVAQDSAAAPLGNMNVITVMQTFPIKLRWTDMPYFVKRWRIYDAVAVAVAVAVYRYRHTI
jgi:hypothetical protein